MLTSPPSYAGQSEIANLKTPFNASFQLLLKTNVGPGIEELQSIPKVSSSSGMCVHRRYSVREHT
ncbi:mCG21292, isoform CRA_b [Mus musculus]|nr:mCG21292, isoform CRA_b [Mus musculus]